MDLINQLKKERAELMATMESIIEIVNTNSYRSSDVKKKVIHHSKNVVVQCTTMKKEGFNNVEDTPFKSRFYLAEGEIDVTQDNKTQTMDKDNRTMTLPKGATAKGVAKKDTAIITVIEINEAS